MKTSFYLLTSSLVSMAVIGLGNDVDWFDIAENTDQPAIGCTITSVTNDSFAATAGLQAGDLIGKFDGVYRQVNKGSIKYPHDVEVFTPGDIGTRIVRAPGGPLGIKMRQFTYPWLTYIRGEIGDRGVWDTDLVDFMVALFQTGDFNENQWEDIIDQGYPEDDPLFDLIELTIAWHRGESIQPNQYLERWESELTPIPDTIFHLLEGLALASNNLLLLSNLADIDTAKLDIKEDDLKILLNSGEIKPYRNGRELLDYANSIRTRRIEKQCINQKDQSVRSLFRRKEFYVKHSSYVWYDVLLPKSHQGREIHFQTKIRITGGINTTKIVNNVRMEAWRFDRQAKKYGKIFGGLELSQLKDGSTIGTAKMGEISHRKRYTDLPTFPMNKRGEPEVDPATSSLVEIDIILLKEECAVFYNGRSLVHCSIEEGKGSVLFYYRLSGLNLAIEESAIWLLDQDN